MGINIHDPLVQIKGTHPIHSLSPSCLSPLPLVTESVCGFVAICMTSFRLWLRWSRYWWDDAWAFFSLFWYVSSYSLRQFPPFTPFFQSVRANWWRVHARRTPVGPFQA